MVTNPIHKIDSLTNASFINSDQENAVKKTTNNAIADYHNMNPHIAVKKTLSNLPQNLSPHDKLSIILKHAAHTPQLIPKHIKSLQMEYDMISEQINVADKERKQLLQELATLHNNGDDLAKKLSLLEEIVAQLQKKKEHKIRIRRILYALKGMANRIDESFNPKIFEDFLKRIRIVKSKGEKKKLLLQLGTILFSGNEETPHHLKNIIRINQKEQESLVKDLPSIAQFMSQLVAQTLLNDKQEALDVINELSMMNYHEKDQMFADFWQLLKEELQEHN